jgi:hypothetical protein
MRERRERQRVSESVSERESERVSERGECVREREKREGVIVEVVHCAQVQPRVLPVPRQVPCRESERVSEGGTVREERVCV